jgi:hypothetical protein
MITPQPPVQADITGAPGLFSMPWVNYFSSLAKFLAKPTVYDATLAAGWSAYGAPFGQAQYFIDNSNVVHLTGLVKKSSAVVAWESILTLPAGFRPGTQLVFPTENSGAYCRIDVTQAGTVIISGGGNAYISLNSIIFMVT